MNDSDKEIKELFDGLLPLVEGKCPHVRRLVNFDGEWKWETYYPEPDDNWEDPEIYETETYSMEDKEEFYDYVAKCKGCGTVSIAYTQNGRRAINYCPNCGRMMKGEKTDA